MNAAGAIVSPVAGVRFPVAGSPVVGYQGDIAGSLVRVAVELGLFLVAAVLYSVGMTWANSEEFFRR